jgi:tetratricopeptide (TPR) repeat protein
MAGNAREMTSYYPSREEHAARGGRGYTDMRMKGIMRILAAFLIITAFAIATRERNLVWREPLTMLEDNVRKSPDKGRVHYNLGRQFITEGRIDEAIEQFQAAIRLRPTSEAYNNLGSAYQDKGMIDRSIELYKAALVLDAANAEAYFNLGRAYLFVEGGNNDAIVMLTKAISLKPEYPDAVINLAVAYMRAKKFDEVVQLLQPLTENNGVRPEAFFNLGVAYYQLGNREAAGRELDQLRGLAPQLAFELEKFIAASKDRVGQ